MTRSSLWIAVAIAAFIFLLTGLTHAFWQSASATAAALDDHGLVTTAIVEGKQVDTRRIRTNDGSRTETNYLVTYAFEARPPLEGQPIPLRLEHEVPRAVFDQLQSGQAVEIRYLPENPARADFYPGETRGTARLLGWAMVAMLAVGVAVLGLAAWIGWSMKRPPAAQGPIFSA